MLAITLLVEEEGPPPLIDLDGTVFLQFGLFVLMLIVLSRFMFKPYLKTRQLRHDAIEGAREKAAKMDVEAQKTVADYEAKLATAKQKGGDARASLRAEAGERERAIIGAARDEANRATEAAKGRLATEAAEAKKQLDAQASALARQMASKVLGREVA